MDEVVNGDTILALTHIADLYGSRLLFGISVVLWLVYMLKDGGFWGRVEFGIGRDPEKPPKRPRKR